MLSFKVDFDALPWQSSLPGARSKVHRDGAKQLRLVEFTSEFVEPDWCEKGHVGLVVSGALEIDFRGRVISYPEGGRPCWRHRRTSWSIRFSSRRTRASG